MQLTKAIELLAPFHNAQLVAAFSDELGRITGQLSTGLIDVPFIAVNDSLVVADELFDVLVAHEAISLIPSERPVCEYLQTPYFESADQFSLFGYELV